MILEAVEGKTTWLEGVEFEQLPHPLPPSIKVKLQGSRLGIEPQGVTGALPLSDGRTIHIHPKFGEANFLRMLLTCLGEQGDLKRQFDGFAKYAADQDVSFPELVARQLYIATDRVLRLSPRFGRVKVEHTSTFAAGQIDPVRTVMRQQSRLERSVVYASRDRTFDIAENRVIGEALVAAWTYLPPDVRKRYEGVLVKWMRLVRRPKRIQEDLRTVEEQFGSNKQRGPRSYYQEPLMLAEMILGVRGMGLGSSVEEVTGDAILINTAGVYEEYLRTVVRRGHTPLGYSIRASDTNVVALYLDGSHELYPDIVIERSTTAVLLADAKYKEPTSADHYQMYTYLSAYGMRRGLLLAPTLGGYRSKDFQAGNGLTVTEVYLPIADLDQTELILSGLTRNFPA